jgi:predicted dehydrogenase
MKFKKIKNLKFGIIGYGSIGKIHKLNIEKLGYSTLIYDPKIDNTKKKYLKKISEINRTCSSVIISSPSNTHLKYLKYFVEKKKHIFIEKPFTHEIKKTSEIIKSAIKNKTIIALNYNLRVRSSIVLLKEILKKIKKIYWSNFIMSSNVLDWRKQYSFKKNYTHNKIAGGIIFDSIHEIDLNNFLFKNVNFINSFKSNFNEKIFKNTSFANINLLIDKKFCSNIQLDYQGDPDIRKLDILTDKGLIKVDIKKNHLKIFNKKNKLKFFKRFNPTKNKDYMKMLKNFISCIKNSSIKPICNSEDGLKNIEIVLKANEK